MTDPQLTQSFEEWWAEAPIFGFDKASSCEAAFAAGVASQQAETNRAQMLEVDCEDRLADARGEIEGQQAEIERLIGERTDPKTGFLWSVLAESAEQELARYEAVVEAVTEAMPDLKYHFHSQIESAGWLNERIGKVAAALAALKEKP